MTGLIYVAACAISILIGVAIGYNIGKKKIKLVVDAKDATEDVQKKLVKLFEEMRKYEGWK